MNLLYSLLAMLGAVVLWAFFNFPPDYANKKQVSVFNWTCVAIFAMFSLVFLLNVEAYATVPTVAKYKGLFRAAGIFCIEIVVLPICLIIRNFFIFKPSRRGGSYFN